MHQMKTPLSYFVFLFFMAVWQSTPAQTIMIDSATEDVTLTDFVNVLEDRQKVLRIAEVLEEQQARFSAPGWLKCNFGLTRADHWLKFSLANSGNTTVPLYLGTGTAIIDSLYLYTVRNGYVTGEKLIGEVIPFRMREVKHPTLTFLLHVQPGTTDYYLRVIGNGQPVSLPLTLLSPVSFQQQSMLRYIILGALYGSLVIILLVNLSFYLMTLEKIYFFFFMQTVFSLLSTVYFDGFIKQYMIPDSPYWSNQFVAITLCVSYIFALFFTIEFLNLRTLAPKVIIFYFSLAGALSIIMIFSFFHPAGFRLFVLSIILMTMAVAALMFFSVLLVRTRGFVPFAPAFWTIISLIFFGSVYQLTMSGIIPDNNFTHYGIHLAVISQAVLLTMGISIKFKIIKEDKERVQQKLFATLDQYSQTLINSIENERQRLAADLHDSLGQSLLVMRNRLLLYLKKKEASDELKFYLASLANTTSEALTEVRAISHDLRPAILDTFGLSASIRSLSEKVADATNLNVCLEIRDDINHVIQKDLQINVYRIFQEAFNNIVKHAVAKRVKINVSVENSMIELRITDDGIGFNPSIKSEGLGLTGIRERVNLMKGNIEIRSEHGKGTTLSIVIPCHKK